MHIPDSLRGGVILGICRLLNNTRIFLEIDYYIYIDIHFVRIPIVKSLKSLLAHTF